MSFARSKLLWVAGVCLILLVFAIHMLTIERQAAWNDEVFVVSTGLSMARSQPPIPSPTAQYPGSDSPIRFYGPVSFVVAALQIRAFGLSAVSWRLICFAGVILTVLVSIALVRLAGGGKWGQLTAALVLALAGSIATRLPGRWDFVTAGLFLGGLLLFLRSVELSGRALLWRVMVAGALVGFALGSTPRALTLCLAALVSALVAALLFGNVRKNLLLGTLGISIVAPLVQTLLLLPWGLNSLSWYAYVRQATRQDALDVTPLVGRGAWDLDLPIHKSFVLVFLLLLVATLGGAVAHLRSAPKDPKLPLKVLLTLFAVLNLSLMLLLIGRSLGQSVFWMPPAVIAMLSWFDWESLRARKLGSLAAGLVGVALLVLIFQEAQNEIVDLLTWNRSSNADLTAFVRRTLPKHAVVYGPVGGYFYSVEMAGGEYLYLHNQARGRPSDPHASLAGKIEEEVCLHPTYAMWPEPDPPHQPFWGPMPEPLRARTQPKVGEFREPPLSPWTEGLLRRMGSVGGKYGDPDVAIYPLRSLDRCGKP